MTKDNKDKIIIETFDGFMCTKLGILMTISMTKCINTEHLNNWTVSIIFATYQVINNSFRIFDATNMKLLLQVMVGNIGFCKCIITSLKFSSELPKSLID